MPVGRELDDDELRAMPVSTTLAATRARSVARRRAARRLASLNRFAALDWLAMHLLARGAGASRRGLSLGGAR